MAQILGFTKEKSCFSDVGVACVLFQSLRDRSWHKLPDMPGAKAWARAVRLGDNIVVIGGETRDKSECCRVFAFDTHREAWVEWVSTLFAYCGAASDGDRLFVAGGRPPGGVCKPVSDVYELSKDRSRWVKRPSMPNACTTCSAAILRNKLYVLGNTQVKNKPLVVFLIFDLVEETWTGIDLSTKISGRLSGGLKHMSLAVLGDFVVSDRLVAYNVTSRRCEDIPGIGGSGPSDTYSLCAVDQRLLALRQSVSQHAFMLSDDRMKWDKLAPMTTTRALPAVCAVNGIVYVMGGKDHEAIALRSAECFK